MQSLKVCGPFGSLDFQTLPFLGPLQKLLLPFIFRGSNIPAKKFKIGAIKQNKKPCQITCETCKGGFNMTIVIRMELLRTEIGGIFFVLFPNLISKAVAEES